MNFILKKTYIICIHIISANIINAMDNNQNNMPSNNEAKPFNLIFKQELSSTIVNNIQVYQKEKTIHKNIEDIDKIIDITKKIIISIDPACAVNLTYYSSYIKNLLNSRKYYERQLKRLFFVIQIEDHENKKK